MTRRVSPAVCAAIAALALLAACAQPGTPVGDVAPGLGAPIAPGGAQDWDGFPVDQKPRPIIVTGGGLAEISGFNSGDGKLAFMTGRIELAAPLPETPATVTADLPDGRFAFPALRPDEAFALVRGQGEPANAPDASPAPIRITTITLGSAEFGTDRGRLRLPAWLFDGPDFIEPVAWPALAKEAFWRYGEPNDAVTIGPDQLSREGRRIRYAVPGQSNCPSQPVMRYRVEVTETAATVVLTTVGEVVSTPAPAAKDQPCLAIGVAAVPYDVDLSEPLGNRVVIAATDGARN